MESFISRSVVYDKLHQELLRESVKLKELFIVDFCKYLRSTSGSSEPALDNSLTKIKIAGFIEYLRAVLTAKLAINQSAYDRYMIDVFTDYIVVYMETESPAFTVYMWELRIQYKSLYNQNLICNIPTNNQNIYFI